MANVTGDAAEDVSSYMTAIWENFANGSENLEYYADVITKLGAATAASSSEIAGGMEKFAAVADTIGLSYEYAASALTTIVAKTRQSEDTVGNGLRTIFSRLQSVSQGETLDDGVTLTKYSTALKKIGVDILDAEGELKQADEILDDLGEKWETLSTTQQNAVAQTVGGVRQYVNLVSLMDNWDFFKQNVAWAEGSEGELDKQAEIYADSWEAAQNRVTAALQGIYDSLIDEDFFKNLYNGFADILDQVNNVIDGIGGIKGILAVVGSVFASVMAKNVPEYINSAVQSIKQFTGVAKREALQTKAINAEYLDEAMSNPNLSNEDRAQMYGSLVINKSKSKYIQNESSMSNKEKQEWEMQQSQLQSLVKIYEQKARIVDVTQQEVNAQKELLTQELLRKANEEKINKLKEENAGKISAKKNQLNLLNSYDSLKSFKSNLSSLSQTEITDENRSEVKQQLLTSLNTAQSNGLDLSMIGTTINRISSIATTTGLKKAIENINNVVNDNLAMAENIAGGDTTEVINQAKVTLTNALNDFVRGESEEKANELRANVGQYMSAVENSSYFKSMTSGLSSEQVSSTKDKAKTYGTNYLNSTSQNQKNENFNNFLGSLTTLKNAGLEYKKVIGSMDEALSGELQADAVDGFLEKIEQLTKGIQDKKDVTAQDIEELEALVKQFNTILSNVQNRQSELDTEVEQVGAKIEDGTEKVKMKQLAEKNGAVKADSAKTALNVKVPEDEPSSTIKLSTAFTQLTSQVMSASAAIYSVKNAVDVLNDTDATFSDKLTAAFTAVSASVMTFSQIPNTLEAGSIIIDALTKRLGAAATAAATAGGGIAGLTAGVGALLGPVGIAIAVIGALTAAIYGIYYVVTKDSREAEERLNSLTETVNNLSTAYDNLNTEYTELQSSIEDYESAYEAFTKLEEGSTDYAEALATANKYARLLIEAQGLIKGEDYHIGNNGEIIIDNTQALEDEKKSQVTRAEVASIVAEKAKGQEEWNQSTAGIVTSAMTEAQFNQFVQAVQEKPNETVASILNYEFGSEVGRALKEALKVNGFSPEQLKQGIQNGSITSSIYSDAEQHNVDNTNTTEGAIADFASNANLFNGDVSLQNAYAALAAQNENNIYQQALEKVQDTDSVLDYAESLGLGTFSGQQASAQLYAKMMGATDYTEATYDEKEGKITVGEQEYEVGDNDSLNSLIKNLLIAEDIINNNKGELEFDDEIVNRLNEIQDSTEYSDAEKKEIIAGIANGNITGNQINDSNYLKQYSQQQIVLDPYADLISSDEYSAVKELTSDLDFGGTIESTAEGFETLKTILGEDFSNYFLDMGNGTYKLIKLAETLNATISQSEIDTQGEVVDNQHDILSGLQSELDEQGVSYSKETGQVHDIENPESYDLNKTGFINAVNDYDSTANVETYEEALAYYQQIADAAAQAEIELATMVDTTARLDEETQEHNLSQEAQETGLVNIASQYEECEEAIQAYNDEVKAANKIQGNAEKKAQALAKAERKLWHEVRKQEWAELEEDVEDYVDTLSDSESTVEDQEDAYKGLAKAFDKTFGTNLQSAGDKYNSWLKKWATSNDETKNDIGETIVEMSKLDQAIANIADNDVIAIKANGEELTRVLDNGQNIFALAKSYIESNPIQVDAYGQADMSGLINSLLEAGATGEQVAAVLAALGQSHIELAFNTESLGSFDLTTQEGIRAFTNALKSWDADLYAEGQYAAIGSSGAQMQSAGSGSSGGGGGGSSSSEPATPKKESTKSAKDETDRYHVIENQLEDLQDQYDAIATAKDRAFGKERLKLIDQEISKNQTLINGQKEYLAEAKAYLALDKAAMEQYGATFDENGTINNYQDLLNSQLQAYNDQVAYYNSLSAEEQDALDEEWSQKMDENGQVFSGYLDAFDKKYEEFKTNLENYEESQDLVKEKEQEIQELQNEIADLQLERIEYVVDIQIDADDFSLDYLDFLLEQIKDDAYDAADAIALIGQKADEYAHENSVYEQGVKDIFAQHGFTDSDFEAYKNGDQDVINRLANTSFTEDEMDTLREYNENLLETAQDLAELREEMHETVRDAFDEFNDEMDDTIDRMETLQDLMNDYTDIIDIVGQDTLGISDAMMDAFANQKVEQAISKLDAVVAKEDAIRANIQKTQEAYNEALARGSEAEIAQWEETLQQMDEELQDAMSDTAEAWKDALESANEALEQAAESAAKSMEKIMNGGELSTEELQEYFDRAKEIDDQYVDDYEKIYDLTKLNREIQQSIDDTPSIQGKQELLALQEEINDRLNDGSELSEYEIEHLEKQYELKLAMLALEEARNAKSEIRMTRSDTGDWSYTYVADEDAVAEAEQSYEDKLYENQQLNSEYIKTLQDSIVSLQGDMSDALIDIMADTDLTYEDKMAKAQELADFYEERMTYLYSQLGVALNNNQDLYNTDWQNYHDAYGYGISANEDFIDSFDETTLSMLTGVSDISSASQNVVDALGSTDGEGSGFLGAMNNALATWAAQVEAAMNSAGTSTLDFGKDLTYVADDITESLSDYATYMQDELTPLIEQIFADIVNQANQWENDYGTVVDQILAKNTQLGSSFASLSETAASMAALQEQITEAEEVTGDISLGGIQASTYYTAPTYSSGGGGDDDGGSSSSGTGSSKGGYKWVEYGNGMVVPYSNAYAGFDTTTSFWADQWGGIKKVTSAASGGYTGDWGSDNGKLAFLHEKELVLNQEDTNNMLKMVELARQWADIIDVSAATQTIGYSDKATTVSYSDKNDSEMVQNITINADFPNATDADEIREAFKSMTNLASQYAGRWSSKATPL